MLAPLFRAARIVVDQSRLNNPKERANTLVDLLEQLYANNMMHKLGIAAKTGNGEADSEPQLSDLDDPAEELEGAPAPPPRDESPPKRRVAEKRTGAAAAPAALPGDSKQQPPELLNFLPREYKRVAFDMRMLNSAKNASQSDDILQFIIISLRQKMGIKAKTAVNFLTGTPERLSNIIIHGLKHDHRPVVKWYQELHNETKKMVELLRRRPQDMVFAFLTLQAGFMSRSVDVATWTCRLFARLGFSLTQSSLSEQLWKWFVTSGLECVINAYKLHGSLKTPLFAVLDNFGRTRMLELLEDHVWKIFASPPAYWGFLHEFMEPIALHTEARETFLKGGSFEMVLTQGMHALADRDTAEEERVAVLGLVVEMLRVFEMEMTAAKADDAVLDYVRRGCRESSILTQTSAMTLLFALLDTWAPQPRLNERTMELMRSTVLLVLENISNITQRHFLLENLGLIIGAHPELPLGPLLEPYLKIISNLLQFGQIGPQLTESQGNIPCTCGIDNGDLFLLTVLAKHPRLEPTQVLALLRYLGRVATEDTLYGRATSVPFLILLNRFHRDRFAREFVDEYAREQLKYLVGVSPPKMNPPPTKDGDRPRALRLSTDEWNRRKTLVVETLAKIISLYREPLSAVVRSAVRRYQDRSRDGGGLRSLRELCDETERNPHPPEPPAPLPETDVSGEDGAQDQPDGYRYIRDGGQPSRHYPELEREGGENGHGRTHHGNGHHEHGAESETSDDHGDNDSEGSGDGPHPHAERSPKRSDPKLPPLNRSGSDAEAASGSPRPPISTRQNQPSPRTSFKKFQPDGSALPLDRSQERLERDRPWREGSFDKLAEDREMYGSPRPPAPGISFPQPIVEQIEADIEQTKAKRDKLEQARANAQQEEQRRKEKLWSQAESGRRDFHNEAARYRSKKKGDLFAQVWEKSYIEDYEDCTPAEFAAKFILAGIFADVVHDANCLLFPPPKVKPVLTEDAIERLYRPKPVKTQKQIKEEKEREQQEEDQRKADKMARWKQDVQARRARLEDYRKHKQNLTEQQRQAEQEGLDREKEEQRLRWDRIKAESDDIKQRILERRAEADRQRAEAEAGMAAEQKERDARRQARIARDAEQRQRQLDRLAQQRRERNEAEAAARKAEDDKRRQQEEERKRDAEEVKRKLAEYHARKKEEEDRLRAEEREAARASRIPKPSPRRDFLAEREARVQEKRARDEEIAAAKREQELAEKREERERDRKRREDHESKKKYVEEFRQKRQVEQAEQKQAEEEDIKRRQEERSQQEKLAAAKRRRIMEERRNEIYAQQAAAAEEEERAKKAALAAAPPANSPRRGGARGRGRGRGSPRADRIVGRPQAKNAAPPPRASDEEEEERKDEGSEEHEQGSAARQSASSEGQRENEEEEEEGKEEEEEEKEENDDEEEEEAGGNEESDANEDDDEDEEQSSPKEATRSKGGVLVAAPGVGVLSSTGKNQSSQKLKESSQKPKEPSKEGKRLLNDVEKALQEMLSGKMQANKMYAAASAAREALNALKEALESSHEGDELDLLDALDDQGDELDTLATQLISEGADSATPADFAACAERVRSIAQRAAVLV